MAEYIDREAAMHTVCKVDCQEYYQCRHGFCQTVKALSELPAADVAPVVHGRWLHVEFRYGFSTYKCDKCGRTVQYNGEFIGIAYPYCHCGAKMDGDSHGA